ncbi:hypothetical protein MES4922_210011 [Mesorhizobium ventifaucium]|uniref:Uncharacterized protein n=1 Tax=Mesorhizobium ventifaucium TaxID=666020 RepID=A0ABM9DS78_9HYPH|nr:hypothetical protein MES4922_210011 [Mesorhizobium ventifaucium]
MVDPPGFERQTVGQGCSPHRASAIGAHARSHEDAGVAAAGFGDHRHQLCLREDRRSATIGDDVGKLVGLGGWVDRTEGRPCLEDGEDRNSGLPAIVHENDDPIIAPDAVRQKGSGKAAREIVQFFVAQPFMLGDQCRLGGMGSGIRGQKMFDPHGRSSPIALERDAFKSNSGIALYLFVLAAILRRQVFPLGCKML